MRAELLDILREAQAQGFLGPGPVAEAYEVSAGFAGALRAAGHVVDLGSGGGIPGLVIAELLAESRVTLLEAKRSRTDFLQRVIRRLGWERRVDVLAERAEVVGRMPDRRGAADAVVARGFGPPPVTAECAAPLLRVGGQLVVSDPPDVRREDRWPPESIAVLGLSLDPVGDETRVTSLTQVRPCPERFPRRRLEPPLWTFHVKP